MKKLLPFLISVSLGSFSAAALAENLVQVYQQARATNPDLRKSAAERDAAYEKINEVRSVLLPQLGLGGSYTYNSGYRDASGTRYTTTAGSLTLTQVLFDIQKWRQLTAQEKTAGIQDVAFQSDAQNLLLRTATAYFNVLRAVDALDVIEAKKKSIYRQLDQTTQRFNVGLVAITDVQNARAQYDSVLADEVTARNNLDQAIENLRLITGHEYRELASLNIDRFNLRKPDNIQRLLKEAENRNLSLLSARLAQDLSRENVRIQQGGHYPTVGLKASSTLSKTDYTKHPAYSLQDDSTVGQNQIGLTLSFPLYAGGGISSRVKQAQYDFVSASEQLESTHRSVVQTVRTSWNNINASASSVAAYKQAVVSAQSSLDAMEAGYSVGTRTIVDVLNATTVLYNARLQLSNARYDYLINNLTLKSALGTLNEHDLEQMNSVLGKPVVLANTLSEAARP